MLYDVAQVASKLNVSKQSIYNKLKLKEFKSKVLIKQGKSYVDDTLFNLIKDSLKLNKVVKSDLNNSESAATTDLQNTDNIIDTDSFNDLLKLNKDLIKTLKDQLIKKDQQIFELHKLIENNQVLLREKQQQDIKQLEEHFTELNVKIEKVQQQMQVRKQNNKNSKFNFFKKLFKR